MVAAIRGGSAWDSCCTNLYVLAVMSYFYCLIFLLFCQVCELINILPTDSSSASRVSFWGLKQESCLVHPECRLHLLWPLLDVLPRSDGQTRAFLPGHIYMAETLWMTFCPGSTACLPEWLVQRLTHCIFSLSFCVCLSRHGNGTGQRQGRGGCWWGTVEKWLQRLPSAMCSKVLTGGSVLLMNYLCRVTLLQRWQAVKPTCGMADDANSPYSVLFSFPPHIVPKLALQDTLWMPCPIFSYCLLWERAEAGVSTAWISGSWKCSMDPTCLQSTLLVLFLHFRC